MFAFFSLRMRVLAVVFVRLCCKLVYPNRWPTILMFSHMLDGVQSLNKDVLESI